MHKYLTDRNEVNFSGIFDQKIGKPVSYFVIKMIVWRINLALIS